MAQHPLQFRRWVYPAAPFVAIAGAVVLCAVIDRVRGSFETKRWLFRSPAWVTGALVLVAVVQPLWGGAMAVSQLTATPTYGLVEAWLREHAAEADRVLLEEGAGST
jgi:hypothetical protein